VKVEDSAGSVATVYSNESFVDIRPPLNPNKREVTDEFITANAEYFGDQ
jgi:hypothetical protein